MSRSEDQIEKLARELFQQEAATGFAWSVEFQERPVGRARDKLIGDRERDRFRSLARAKLEMEDK